MNRYKPAAWLTIIVALATAGLVFLIVGAPCLVAQQPAPSGNTQSDPASEFNPRRLLSPFRPIVGAPVIPAKKVTDQVFPGELVLGVVVRGQARAYPINMLTGPSREIINDKLGGQPIAATW